MSREVLVTLERIRRNQSSVWADERIRRVAHQALTIRGPHGTTGAFGQFLGHHFEYLDALDFNLRNAREGLTLVLKQHAHFPGYDADIRRNDQIVKAVQHKFGCKGISKAIAVLEQTHPGTAARDVLRVPADQITKAVRVANGRITVAASNHTRATVETRATTGLTAISKRGTAAASLGRVTSRATVAGAAISATIGGVRDAKKLRSGEISAACFVKRRGAEAGISAATTIATATATTGLTAGLMAIGATGGLGSATSIAALASPMIIPVAAGVVASVTIGVTSRRMRRVDAPRSARSTLTVVRAR